MRTTSAIINLLKIQKMEKSNELLFREATSNKSVEFVPNSTQMKYLNRKWKHNKQ